MTLIGEYWTLIKGLFTKVSTSLKHVEMKYVLWKNYFALMWCSMLITRPGAVVSQTTKVHEGIHLQQARIRGGWWPFYFLYLMEYLWNLLVLWLGVNGAYYCISVEMQAYGRQEDPEYKVTKENMKLYRFSWRKKKIWRQNKNNWRAFTRGIEE